MKSKRRFPVSFNIYMSVEQKEWVEKKATEGECSVAHVIRKSIREQMKKDQSENSD